MAARCASCGSPLDGRRGHARYCSGACRAAASRQRMRALSRVRAAERVNGSHSPEKAHRSAHSGPWVLLRDADALADAVLATFPGSYELPPDGGAPLAR